METIGQIARSLRLRRGWTARQLGEKLGVTHSTISLRERGVWPTHEIPQLARVFAVPESVFEVPSAAVPVSQSPHTEPVPQRLTPTLIAALNAAVRTHGAETIESLLAGLSIAPQPEPPTLDIHQPPRAVKIGGIPATEQIIRTVEPAAPKPQATPRSRQHG